MFLDEIERMFCFIESCEDPQEICYDEFLQNAVAAVAAVANGQEIAIPEKFAVAKPNSAEAKPVAVAKPEAPSIKDELQRAEAEHRSHEEHFKTPEGERNDGVTILRFLQPVPAFMGTDLQPHGPFQREDVATVPSLNATGLIFKDLAVVITPTTAIERPANEVHEDEGKEDLGRPCGPCDTMALVTERPDIDPVVKKFMHEGGEVDLKRYLAREFPTRQEARPMETPQSLVRPLPTSRPP